VTGKRFGLNRWFESASAAQPWEINVLADEITISPSFGVLLMAGCPSSHILISAKANRAIPAKSNHVVMPANDMEDFDAADRLAVLTEEVLHRRGFRSDRSRDADVIVVTQAACVTASGQEIAMKPAQMRARSTVPREPPEDTFGSVAALALGVRTAGVGSPYMISLLGLPANRLLKEETSDCGSP
jgi:hypothetical protein